MRRCYEVLFDNFNSKRTRFHAIVREIDDYIAYEDEIKVDTVFVFDNSINWRKTYLTIPKENIIRIINKEENPEYFL